MNRFKTTIVCGAGVLFLVAADATDLSSCRNVHSKAKDACTQAKDAAKRIIDAASAQAAANTQGSGDGHSNQGSELAKTGSTATAAAADAKKTCNDEKKKCDDACDGSKASKKEEKPKIDQEKKKCAEDIKTITDILDASTGQSEKATEGGDKTKEASKGEGGGSPSSGGGDKDKDKDTDTKDAATTAATPTDTAASGSGAAQLTPALAGTAKSGACPGGDQDYLNEDCVSDLTKECATDKSSAKCQAFNARYCGTGGGSEASGATLKTGAGLSEDYCRNQNAQAFCNGGSTDQCASCRKLRGLSPLPDSPAIAAACSSDPSSLPTPSAVQTASAGGGMGGGGGSSGGGTGGATLDPNAVAKTGAKLEGDENKSVLSKMSMGVGGGGGGGGGSGGGPAEAGGVASAVDDFLAGYGVTPGRGLAKAKESAEGPVVAASITDVAPFRGADVFRIQSLVLKARCDADKELNCPPRN